MTAYTIYTYDSMEVGQALDPVEHRVTAELVREYAEATGDRSPWHTGAESPFGEAVAHPALVTVFTTAVLERSAKGGPSGGIHAKQEYEFLAPSVSAAPLPPGARSPRSSSARGAKPWCSSRNPSTSAA